MELGHDPSKLFTAAIISSTVIPPSPSRSPAGQTAIPWLPKAMFTMVTISSTVTSLLPLQSPRHWPRDSCGSNHSNAKIALNNTRCINVPLALLTFRSQLHACVG